MNERQIHELLAQMEQARQHATATQHKYRSIGDNQEADYWMGVAMGFNGAKQLLQEAAGISAK